MPMRREDATSGGVEMLRVHHVGLEPVVDVGEAAPGGALEWLAHQVRGDEVFGAR